MSRSRSNNRKKDNTTSRKIIILLMIVCAITAAASALFIVKQLAEYKENDDVYKEAVTFASGGTETETAQADSGQTEEGFPNIDFAALTAEGPDVKAWIKIPGTEINYPVTYTDDDDFYLDHLYNRKPGKAGSIFIEAQNRPDFSDQNTIVYGHAMKNGSMFAYLLRFRNQDYLDEHPYAYLVTPDARYKVMFFSAFKASPSESGKDTGPWRAAFKDQYDYEAWLENMRSRSDVKSDVDVSSADRTLTLSTCADKGKSRYIVIGKLVN